MTLKGPRLLQYKGADGQVHSLTAADVNAYLQRVSGASISAKDFRMTRASAMAAKELAAVSPPAASESGRRRQINAVMHLVAEQLVNTPAVAHRSYVHAIVEDLFRSGALPKNLKGRPGRALSIARGILFWASSHCLMRTASAQKRYQFSTGERLDQISARPASRLSSRASSPARQLARDQVKKRATGLAAQRRPVRTVDRRPA